MHSVYYTFFVILLICRPYESLHWMGKRTISSPSTRSRLDNNFYGGPPRNPASRLLMSDGTENDTTNNPVQSEVLNGDNGAPNFFEEKWNSFSDELRDDIKTSVISFGFALLVRIFLVEPRFIPSLSMYPTFDIGDQLLVDKISHLRKPYQKRDVIVFNPSETYTELTGNTEALIKRVIATAGDIVEVKNNHVYVNGNLQDEPYINELPDYTLSPTKVPAGMLLVLGDNRNHSFDSHVWGFLPEKNVVGRAIFKYWPLWRFGTVEGSL